MKTFRLQYLTIVLVLLAPPAVYAFQEETREEQNRAARLRKAAMLSPEKPGAFERGLLWVQERKALERLGTRGGGFHGIRPRLGGLSTGSGFGFGLRYDLPRTAPRDFDLTLVGAVSTRTYQLYDLVLDLPRPSNGRLVTSVQTRYRSMPQEDFFGIGPDSRKADRTSYLYEDASAEFSLAFRAAPRLWFGTRNGWVGVNVGPGTDPRFPRTEERFSDTQAPGLERQSDFIRNEVFAIADTRDAPGNPVSGTLLRGSWSAYHDRSFSLFGFRRFEGELQQYFPFFHGHRVIAFRFSTTLDTPSKGQRVPFYLQKPLGGSNDLRGFREFRFRDLNQMVATLEYRWQVFSGMDMAIFGDTGKVFPERGQFNFERLKSDAGLGFRFNAAGSVFLRLDVARGPEGTRFFVKFEHVF